MSSSAPARLAPWSRRFVVRLLAMLLILVAAWAAVLAYLRVRADRALRDAVAETERLDPYWTFEEVEARRITLPDDQNSAVVVRQIKKRLPRQWPPETAVDGTARPGAPPIPVPPALDSRVAGLSPELALSDRLADELQRELS